MTTIDLRSAATLARAVQDGSLRAADVAATALAAIASRNDSTNAFVETFADTAMAQAERVDA
ncbi:MAG: hypothetical protein ABL997_18800, partial [Planctomycetota bacterium]